MASHALQAMNVPAIYWRMVTWKPKPVVPPVAHRGGRTTPEIPTLGPWSYALGLSVALAWWVSLGLELGGLALGALVQRK